MSAQYKSRNYSDEQYNPSITIYPEISEFKVPEMKDREKTKEQLVNELVKMRRYIVEMLKSEDKFIWAEKMLKKLQEEQQTILDSVPASIFYKDTENRFLRVNKVFAERMGMSKEQLEGTSLFELYPREKAEAFWKEDKEVIASGKAKIHIIETVETKDGWLLVQTDKIPYHDIQGNIIGIVCFSVDITEHQKREIEQLKLIAALQKAISEIKTFLNGLIPICASCNKIYSDEECWEQIENYFADYLDTKFSRGLSSDRAKKIVLGILSGEMIT
jgi:PAS domain S-box-containing protein